MRYIRLIVPLTIVMLLVTWTVSSQDYSKKNRETFERIFAPRKFSKDRWHFVGLPLSGNILGTARLNEKDVPIEDRIKLINPDKWFNESVSEQERKTLNKAIIDTYEVGPVDLNETTARSRGGSLSFPGLFQILGLDASVASSKGVTTKMHIDKASVRELDYTKFAEAYNKRKFDPSVYEALKQDIIMCFADIKFTGLKTTVTVDKSRDIDVGAKLQAKVGTILGENSTLKVKVEDKGNGTFVIEPTGAVTVAYLFRSIPKKSRELDPSGYLLLGVSRGEAPQVIPTDNTLEKELTEAILKQRAQ